MDNVGRALLRSSAISFRDRLETGSEFVGRARQMRKQIADHEELYAEQIRQLTDPIYQRSVRCATPDRADLSRPVKVWRELQTDGRLSLDVSLQRTNPTIDELRVGACRLQGYDWEYGEPSVSIIRLSLIVKRRHFALDTTVLAIIGLHALARRIARGWSNDRDSIMSELRTLSRHADNLRLDQQFSLTVPDGRWVGETIQIGDHLALRVQTFLI